MKYLMVDMYKGFQCIGSGCPDTCCAGWNVVVDEKSVHTYQEVSGEFGEKLQKNLYEKDGDACFKRPNRRCAFLTEDNLCEIYQKLGKENMCATCKTYPRVNIIYGDVTFCALTLSCPEVVRLLMEHEDAVQFDFAEDENVGKAVQNTDWSLFNTMIFGFNSSIEILQNRSLSVPVRIRLFLLFNAELQNCLEQNKGVDALKELFGNPNNYSGLARTLEGNMRNDVAKLHMFVQFISISKDMSFFESFQNQINSFANEFRINFQDVKLSALFNHINVSEYDEWYENYCVYYLARHYMESMEKKNPLQKAEELVWMLNLQQCMMAAATLNDSGQLTKETHIWIVNRLSRTLEHDSKNFEKVREEILHSYQDVCEWLSLV